MVGKRCCLLLTLPLLVSAGCTDDSTPSPTNTTPDATFATSDLDAVDTSPPDAVSDEGPKVAPDASAEDTADGDASTEVTLDVEPDVVPDAVGLDVTSTVGFDKLCQPCTENLDCEVLGAPGLAVCMDYGDSGNFCGVFCTSDDDCPEPHTCQDAELADGTPTKQCARADLFCACNDLGNQLGMATPCAKSNVNGTCAGEHRCGAAGTGTCDAQEPVAEVCDGLDNNCDGATDEGSPDLDDDGEADCIDSDDDGDAVKDDEDNCPGVANNDQTDTDGDLEGDACDIDDDGDGVIDTQDCEPLDPTIHIGAQEICDGIDQDCDNAIDEGLCDDGVDCTVDYCDINLQACVNAPDPVACDDGEDCTTDTCDAVAGCQFAPQDSACDDGVPCTVDSCDATDGCQATADDTACDDNDACTGVELCDATTGCQTGTPLVVDDGVTCTVDVCDPSGGVSNTPDDGLCDDANPCTAGSCDPVNGCQQTALDGVSCDDQDPQTTADACNGTVCEGLADDDEDGIADVAFGTPCASGATTGCDDNCVGIPNPLQEDADGNGVGDACESGCPPGGYCPDVDDTLCGTVNVPGLYIPAGVTVSCQPGCTQPLVINVTGNAVIEGTLDLNGAIGDGWNAANNNPTGAPAQPGAVGRCGGFNGGTGGASFNNSGTSGLGGGGGGGSATPSGIYWNGGNAGGGGFGTSGIGGFQGGGTGIAGGGSGVQGNAQLSPLRGGSGGGGGSGGLGGASTGFSGAGGGAGGGAVQIIATGQIHILAGGVIQADGGRGGDSQNLGASGGGGAGSGGAIWLSAPTVINEGSVTALGGRNLYLNGGGPLDGGGGAGRVRVDTSSGTPPGGSFDPAIGYVGTY